MLTRLQYTCFVKAEKISVTSRSQLLSACDRLSPLSQPLTVITYIHLVIKWSIYLYSYSK